MGQKKPGIMVYWEVFDMLDAMEPEQVKPMLRAIRDYGEKGTEPEFQSDPLMKVVWPLIGQKIEADSRRYETVCSRNRVNGYISAYKRSYAPSHGLDPNDRGAIRDYILSRMGQGTPATADGGMPDEPTASPAPPSEPDPSAAQFVPPSIREVQAYCREKNSPVDPEKFYNYYTSIGWKVGKYPMQDWKAAMETWKVRERQNGKTELCAYGQLGREV